jgi:protein-tyrosine phosphatase
MQKFPFSFSWVHPLIGISSTPCTDEDWSIIKNKEIAHVVVLLQPHEIRRLNYSPPKDVTVFEFNILDTWVPDLAKTVELIEVLASHCERGNKLLIHCKRGFGRSGLIAACLLLKMEITLLPSDAINHLRSTRSPYCFLHIQQIAFVSNYFNHLKGNAITQTNLVSEYQQPNL